MESEVTLLLSRSSGKGHALKVFGDLYFNPSPDYGIGLLKCPQYTPAEMSPVHSRAAASAANPPR